MFDKLNKSSLPGLIEINDRVTYAGTDASTNGIYRHIIYSDYPEVTVDGGVDTVVNFAVFNEFAINKIS